ncbi:MAG TPA: hypothetical protein VFK69_02080 [Candidatus Eisenbacteria bacterium]|nr:hypothetical protein [Candidatus Eisenbacteria bacterium]
MNRSLTIALTLLVCCGCATTSTNSIRMNGLELAPRPAGSPVTLYSTEPPGAKELGRVRASKRGATAFSSVNEDDVLPLLKEEARKLGGNGIVSVSFEGYHAASLNGRPNIPAVRASGIAILVPDSSGTAK